MSIFGNCNSYSNPEYERGYSIDSDGRIRPVNSSGGLTKWDQVATFDQALASIIKSETYLHRRDEAIPPDEIKHAPEEFGGWSPIVKAVGHLNIVEGFFFATGINVDLACFAFQWQGETFYNIRPDFDFLLLREDGSDPTSPINEIERNILDEIISICPLEIYAIPRAIQAGEIDPYKVYPIEWWREFWTKRGTSVLFDNFDGIKAEKPLGTTERNTLLCIIAALCDNSQIKHQERGAAARIARLTQASGAPVNEDTISKALQKIPNALETRMK